VHSVCNSMLPTARSHTAAASYPWVVIVRRAGLPCFMLDGGLHDRYLLGDGFVLEAWAYVAVYVVGDGLVTLLQCMENQCSLR
jgi:hypothetical protein